MRARYGQFGAYLGMAAQLTNDLAAIAPGAEEKADVVMRRPTLPLTYAARVSPRTSPEENDAGMSGLWTEGAAHLTWAVADGRIVSAPDAVPRMYPAMKLRMTAKSNVPRIEKPRRVLTTPMRSTCNSGNFE